MGARGKARRQPNSAHLQAPRNETVATPTWLPVRDRPRLVSRRRSRLEEPLQQQAKAAPVVTACPRLRSPGPDEPSRRVLPGSRSGRRKPDRRNRQKGSSCPHGRHREELHAGRRGFCSDRLASSLLISREWLYHGSLELVPRGILQRGIQNGGKLSLLEVPPGDVGVPRQSSLGPDGAPAYRHLPQMKRSAAPTSSTTHHHQSQFGAAQANVARQWRTAGQKLSEFRGRGPGQD